jgi:hypothetical protein
VAHSSGDHLLELGLRFGELVPEVVSPIPEQNHRAGVFVVLDVDYCETNYFACLVRIIKIKNLVIFLIELLVWVNNTVETIRLSVDQSCLD